MTDAAKADPQKANAGNEAQGEPSGKGKEPSFEELLAQYGKKPETEQKKEPEKAAETKVDLDQLKRQWFAEFKAMSAAEARSQKDFDKLVNDVVEESGFEEDDARAFVLGLFDKPGMIEAFGGRAKDRDGWNKVRDGLLEKARNVAEKLAAKHSRSDRDSVRAAARTKTGSSPKEKYPAGLENWSDAKFDAWKRENLRQ